MKSEHNNLYQTTGTGVFTIYIVKIYSLGYIQHQINTVYSST